MKRTIAWGLCIGIIAAAAVVLLMTIGAGRGGTTRSLTDGRAIHQSARGVIERGVYWTEADPIDASSGAGRHAFDPAIEPSGTRMIFARGRTGTPGGGVDLYEMRLVDGAWSDALAIDGLNSAHDELGPELSGDGGTILFSSDRPGGLGGFDLWRSRWIDGAWAEPVNLGPGVNTAFDEFDPALTPDGERLYFSSDRPLGEPERPLPDAWSATIRHRSARGDFNLFVAASVDEGYADAHEVSGVNTEADEGTPAVSPAGDFVYFASDRAGGDGGFDLYRFRVLSAGLGPVRRVGGPVNTRFDELDPTLSAEGFAMVFSSDRGGETVDGGGARFDLYRTVSRELFAEATPARAFDFAALWNAVFPWLLLLLLLALLLLLMRRLRRMFSDRRMSRAWKRLSLLARCILVSLLIHAMLLALFTVWRVTTAIQEYLRRESGGGVQVALVPTGGVDAGVYEQVRGEVSFIEIESDVPTIEPASAPAMQELTTEPPPPPGISIEPPAMEPAIPDHALAMERREALQTVPTPSDARTGSERTPENTTEPMRAEPSVELSRRSPSPTFDTPVPATEPPVEYDARPPVSIRSPEVGGADAPPMIALLSPPAMREPTPPIIVGAIEPALPSAQKLMSADSAEPELTMPERADAGPRLASAPPGIETRGPTRADPDPRPRIEAAPPEVSASDTRQGSTPRRENNSLPGLVAGAPEAVALPGGAPSTAEAARPEARPELPAPASPTLTLSAPGVAVHHGADQPDRWRPNIGAFADRRPEVGLGRGDVPSRTGAGAPMPGVDTGLASVAIPRAAEESEEVYPQRAPEVREQLVERGGGGKKTEEAVARALDWLSRHQQEDGRWNSRGFDGGCGACGGAAKYEFDAATTGLALLCFLGADHGPTNEQSAYSPRVRRGVDWLVAQQKPDGDLRGGGTMYTQGIATIALCEAYALSRDESLMDPIRRAIGFIQKGRNARDGGWRYEPGQEGDTSVLGWQVMAMESARRCGVEIDPAVTDGARAWLDRVSTPGARGVYSYQHGMAPTASMTAEGMFVRQLLGASRDDAPMAESARFVLREPPDWRSGANTYGWYYATLALYQHGGEEWKTWNSALVRELLGAQRRDGAAAGSWDPEDQWSMIGGRVYQTALCTLSLEVYYRYLPMSVARQDDDADTDRPAGAPDG